MWNWSLDLKRKLMTVTVNFHPNERLLNKTDDLTLYLQPLYESVGAFFAHSLKCNRIIQKNKATGFISLIFLLPLFFLL